MVAKETFQYKISEYVNRMNYARAERIYILHYLGYVPASTGFSLITYLWYWMILYFTFKIRFLTLFMCHFILHLFHNCIWENVSRYSPHTLLSWYHSITPPPQLHTPLLHCTIFYFFNFGICICTVQILSELQFQ